MLCGLSWHLMKVFPSVRINATILITQTSSLSLYLGWFVLCHMLQPFENGVCIINPVKTCAEPKTNIFFYMTPSWYCIYRWSGKSLSSNEIEPDAPITTGITVTFHSVIPILPFRIPNNARLSFFSIIFFAISNHLECQLQ